MTKKDARDKLYEYTAKIMENITHYYKTTDFNKGTDINLLIERAVSRKVAGAMGDLYVEADVSVFDIGNKTAVVTSYSTDKGIDLLVMHEEVNRPQMKKEWEDVFMRSPFKPHSPSEGYNPKSTAEDFHFGYREGQCSGSQVETLPCGQGLGALDDMSYFRQKLMRGLSAPTSCAPMTNKTSKPTIDFKQISQISAPTNDGLPRYQSGMHVGIDLAKFDVMSEIAAQTAKEMAAAIDKKIMEDMMDACKPQWGVSTFGWTEEKTDWKTPEDITWRTRYDSMPIKSSGFGGILTTDSARDSWINPFARMEEIEFTETELDELIDLIHDCKSEVMKFK